MQLDLIILRQLSENLDNINFDTFELNIPFANIAFIKEKYWRNNPDYIKSVENRSSHPCLSIDSINGKVIFGTSKTDNRNPEDVIFISKKDCQIIDRDMVFLKKFWIYANINMIDYSKTYYAPVSDKVKMELENAGYR